MTFIGDEVLKEVVHLLLVVEFLPVLFLLRVAFFLLEATLLGEGVLRLLILLLDNCGSLSELLILNLILLLLLFLLQGEGLSLYSFIHSLF